MTLRNRTYSEVKERDPRSTCYLKSFVLLLSGSGLWTVKNDTMYMLLLKDRQKIWRDCLFKKNWVLERWHHLLITIQ